MICLAESSVVSWPIWEAWCLRRWSHLCAPGPGWQRLLIQGTHGKVGAGQPTYWAGLPGKGNDSPWLGPTFKEEEMTYLWIWRETTYLRILNDVPWILKRNDQPSNVKRKDAPWDIKENDATSDWCMKRTGLPWKIKRNDIALYRCLFSSEISRNIYLLGQGDVIDWGASNSLIWPAALGSTWSVYSTVKIMN